MPLVDDTRAALSHRLLWGSVLAGAALSLTLTAAIATGALFLGSHEGRWFYPYVRPLTPRALIGAAIAAAAAAALLRITRPGTRTREWLLVAAWIVLATGLQGLMRSPSPYTLESLFVSVPASSFYSVSMENEPSEVLAHFNRVRTRAPWHAQSNMPGKLMLVYALRLVSERTDVLPWLLVILSNLGAVLVYVFARDLFDDGTTALFSAVLYLFVPARIFFFPIMNTVTPVVLLCCACLLLRWLRTGRASWAALLGAALYGLMFFEPLPMVMGLLGVALLVNEVRRGALSWDRAVRHSALALLAFVAVAEAVTWLTGFEVIRAFRGIGGHAVAFNVAESRPYWLWVRLNLLEFLVGVGGCQAMAFGAALLDGLRDPRRPDRSAMVALCLGLLAVLATLDLVGINRGEVIRLWIFLACFFQIPVARVCASLGGRTAITIVTVCTVLQAALGIATIGFVIP